MEAERLLALYGLESHETEIPRVRLAILKNAGADLDNMRYEVGLAKHDYRDAIVAAEFSREALEPSAGDTKKRKRLRVEDKNAYLAWLES